MSSESSATLWIVAVYLIYLLLPLIPAIVIYRLFPDTKVTLKGMVNGLSLNAGGAFAAYVVTVLLGNWLAQSAIDVIRDYQRSSWTVHADVQLADDSGNLINDPDALSNLSVELVPSIVVPSDKEDDTDPKHPIFYKSVDVEVPLVGEDWRKLKYASTPNYAALTIDVQNAQKNIDAAHQRITLKSPIELRKVSHPYQPGAGDVAAQSGDKAAYPGER